MCSALVIFYVTGVLVRAEYGIRVTIHNESGAPVHNLSLKVVDRGKTYALGDLSSGAQERTFVEPVTESQVHLTFLDTNNKSRITTIVGYAEKGYCGNVDATILPNGDVKSRERMSVAFCWGSWFDFI